MTTTIAQAIGELGAYRIANVCGIKGPSVYKWLITGRLPRTEWTGETQYAEKIEALSGGKYSKSALLKKPEK